MNKLNILLESPVFEVVGTKPLFHTSKSQAKDFLKIGDKIQIKTTFYTAFRSDSKEIPLFVNGENVKWHPTHKNLIFDLFEFKEL